MNKFVKTAFFSFGRRLPAFLYSELKRLFEDEAFSKMKLFDDDDDEEKLIFAGADDFFFGQRLVLKLRMSGDRLIK